ncbi:MAG: NUDIX domain-containing protein [Verrucomicrobia bacterium]|nr:NUDIX domain-containing protein [Verrucomicrobiota bacterium]
MKRTFEHFRYCPRCGRCVEPTLGGPLRCEVCGFVYFFNPAAAVGAFTLGPDGRLLMLRRAKDPGKGKLGLPGGFIDIDETAEAALEREIGEEVGARIASWEYLCSEPNQYDYAGVRYPVLDLFYKVRLEEGELRADREEVAGWTWIAPAKLRPADLAFVSVRRAFAACRSRLLD